LEGMKRAALNLLRYHTGTYDIPPLEIVDEDPVPSFLESLQKQQLVTPEAPRKKSKRGDMPKSSIRFLNRDTSINSDDIPRKGRNSVHVDFENFDDRRLKVDEGNNDLEEFDGEDNHLDVPAMQLSADSQMTNMVDEEQGVKAVTSFNNTELNHSHDSVFDQNRNANHPVVYDDEEKSSQQISYHDMETSLYNGMLEYGGNVQQVQGVSFGADLVNNPFNTSLDSVQPLNYDTPTSMVESNIYFANDSQLFVSCGSVHEVVENAAVYTNAVNCQNSSVSVKTIYNEDTNPLNLFDYAAVLNALQAMNDTTSTGPESNYPRNPDTPLSYRVEDVVTTQPEIASVNEAVSSELGRVKCESVEQPKIETPLPITKQPEGVHVRVYELRTKNIHDYDEVFELEKMRLMNENNSMNTTH
uniref:Zinc finger protein n=1 Tax=Angiostrongylus cantonensis TaxID=6313 RepID=A0A0K0DQX3_ANGCA